MREVFARLYKQFDDLYQGIGLVCAACQFHDCEGYIWLLDLEAESLYNKGVAIVELNGNIQFIHSFAEEDGRLMIDKPRPPCSLRHKGLCSIYSDRPLVCRMYPVGLATIHGHVKLVLHMDCEFSQRLVGSAKGEFIGRVLEIIQQIPQDVLRSIYNAYIAVDEISAFPEGPNLFEVVADFPLTP